MSTITLTPDAAGRFTFGKSAAMSKKFDGIQGRWDGRNLTTRDGKPISAPDWFTKQLPRKKLVGELWMGNGTFAECQSVILRKTPDARWRRVKFLIFEGEAEGANVETVRQIPVTGGAHVRQFAAAVIAGGGEGAVVRDRGTFYKIKPCEDAEAVVVGYRAGAGRFKGHTGAILARAGGVSFGIGAGLSDELRRNPPPIGATITYGFQGQTASGKPRFPTFIRERLAA